MTTTPINEANIALKCAEFFMMLGENCLQIHRRYEQSQYKTKLIKKQMKKSTKTGNNKYAETSQLMQVPKKPLTPYILYFRQQKTAFRQKYPNLVIADITKLIAKCWKELKQQERLPYLQEARVDRQRYQMEMGNIGAEVQAKQAVQNLMSDEQERDGNEEDQQQNIVSDVEGQEPQVCNPYSGSNSESQDKNLEQSCQEIGQKLQNN